MAPRNNQIRAHEKHHEVPSLKRETAHGLISAAHTNRISTNGSIRYNRETQIHRNKKLQRNEKNKKIFTRFHRRPLVTQFEIEMDLTKPKKWMVKG